MKFSDKLIAEYKKDANKRLARACRLTMIFMAMVMILNSLKIFLVSDIIYPIMHFSMVVMFIPTLLYDILKWEGSGIQLFVVTLVTLMTGLLYIVVSYHVVMMLVFPVVVAMIYCDKKLVIYTTVVGIPIMFMAHILAFDLHVIGDEILDSVSSAIRFGFFPRVLEYIILSVVCIGTAGKLQQMIKALEEKNNELYEDQLNIITTLSTMIETESKETGTHVKRVSEYTAILCRAIGMDDEEVWKVSLAAMMHDVGKIMIPHEILEKPGKLTSEEFAIIRKHTVFGRRMLENSPGELMRISAQIAYEHHERYDGNGYAGLKGDEIHIYSKCVSIADVFDALVSWRPYKEPWTLEDARKEIVFQGGRQFDPELVKVFDAHFSEFTEIFEKYPDSVESIDTELDFGNCSINAEREAE